MTEFVSGDLPYAIVMEGGGVKGLAFVGALMEIEEHFYFDRHVGISAGAIAAVSDNNSCETKLPQRHTTNCLKAFDDGQQGMNHRDSRDPPSVHQARRGVNRL